MEVYGLVGNPVGHSLSPSMHEAAYAELDIDARYVTFEPDPDELAAAVEGAAALGVAGLNVTVPFKDDVLAHAAPTDLAARVGAVNTLDFGSDPPTGYNTDVAGVRRAFAHENVALSGRTALVVGAGGAGRAAAFALADADATVHVANRTVARAEALAADLPHATAHGLDALVDLVPQADVLVNATTVGMETDESPVPADLLHEDLAVLDAVYRPRETRLLRYAAAAGATTVNGTRMLLYQGAEAFEIWTGETAPIEAMERGLESALDDG